MDVKEMSAFIGKQYSMRVEQTLFIPVTVLDVRKVFQRIDVLVTPVGGNGSQWVCLDRIK